MRSVFSGISFALLLVGVFMVTLSVQSAKVNTSSLGETVQATGVDWWPMFHHDLSHTGTSTSTAPSTNNLLWASLVSTTPNNFVDTAPAVVDGLVYVGLRWYGVYCLNAATGARVWSYTINVGVSSPTVADGRVYVGSADTDDKVYCLDASTGAHIWDYKTDGSGGAPAIVDGRVYVGSGNGKVYCLDASTGAHIWDYKTDGAVCVSPAVVGGLVYTGSMNTGKSVYCLNAANGALVWSYTIGAMVGTSPAVVGGLVYVGSMDNKVYCLNAATGVLVWSYTTGHQVWSSPAVAGGFVYVGSWDNNVYCLNAANGALVWKYKTGNGVGSSSAVADGKVYVGSGDDKVYCLDASTGAHIWDYTTGFMVDSSPAVVGGAVYVGSKDGKVYAFGTPLTVSISPSSVVMDVGQSSLFTSSVSGGSSPYYNSYQWYLNGAPVSGATSATWTFTPTAPSSYAVYLIVTDALTAVGTSNTATATVNRAPAASISPSSATMDVDQSKLFTSTVSDGTSPYAYQWYLNDVAVSGATNTSWTFAPASPGSYTVYVDVTDSVNFMAKSNIASVTVNPPPSVTISPPSITMDVGQSQQFSSSVIDGTSPYTYQWYSNGTAISSATSSTYTFTPTSSGHYNIDAKVTDNVGIAATSNTATVVVNPAPSVTISPPSVTMDVGQSRQFNSSVTDGTPPYTYQWYLNDAPVSDATSSSWIYTPSSTGSYTVYVSATDKVGGIAKSNIATVAVNSLPSVTISPTSVAIDFGQAELFTSSASGGTPPYSYQWCLNGTPVSGATSFWWAYTPSSCGSCCVHVTMTDSVGVAIASIVANITVNPQLAVMISPRNATIFPGEHQNLTSVVSGGTAPYTYQWYVNGAPVSGATSNSWTFTPTSSDSYTLYLLVIDSAGGMAISSASNIIRPPSGEQQQPFALPLFMIAALLAVITIATLLAVIVYRRKSHIRRSQEPIQT